MRFGPEDAARQSRKVRIGATRGKPEAGIRFALPAGEGPDFRLIDEPRGNGRQWKPFKVTTSHANLPALCRGRPAASNMRLRLPDGRWRHKGAVI